jgi:hypothetical protein
MRHADLAGCPVIGTFRNWLGRLFMVSALDLFTPDPTIEGLTAMTIFARLELLEAANAALVARVVTLESASAVDTSGFATADSVTALDGKVSDLASTVGGRLDTIEAEIGSETPADPAPVVEAPAA